MDYQEDLKIDKYALDTECLDQSRRFAQWSENLANALTERDRADQKIKIIEAQVEQDIRIRPQNYIGTDGKLTEAGVRSLVLLNEEVRLAREEHIDAVHKVNIMTTAKQAFEQRRSMIENLVKLYLSGYWADPKIKKEDDHSLGQISTDKEIEALSKSSRLQKRKSPI